MKKRAIVLLSGGLDSATVLAIAAAAGFDIFTLSFRYGQRHQGELACAEAVSKAAGATQHIVMDVDMRGIGGSALTGSAEVPKGRSLEEMSAGIPATYVPARNTIFLSCALAWAEALNCQDIFIGMNALDYSGYPDCRPEFIDAFERLANLATKSAMEGGRIKIHAPLIQMNKAQIIQSGLKLGVDYAVTSSCYEPSVSGRPCGQCDSCLLRAGGFFEVGIPDPKFAS